MGDTARRTFVATLVVVAVVGGALALWKIKVLIALVFLGLVLAAARRPGVARLAEPRSRRTLGVAAHYLAIAGAIALLVWLVVPRAIDQVAEAIGGVPS